LYLNRGLTAAKIAIQVGLSKSEVLRRLHSIGIRRETLKDVAMAVLRPAIRAPFGQRVVDGKIIDDRRELKVARFIVEMRGRQKLRWEAVVRRLNEGGLKTKTGLPWKIGTAKMVFDRWNGKL